MSQRIFPVVTVLLFLIWGTSFTGVGSQSKLVLLDHEIVLNPPESYFGRAACSFQKHSDTAISFYSGWDTGDRFVTYFDLAVECGASPYPFELQSVSFLLYDPGTFQWPVTVDIVVYDLAGADSCSGPGNELCRFSVICDEATFGVPNIGTVNFPTPCCVNGPVFVGLEYSDNGAGPFPSIMFDNSAPVPECDNWAFGPIAWSEWFDFWSPPEPGYPIFFVIGESQSGGCDTSVVINEVRPQPFPTVQNNSAYTYAFAEIYNSGGFVQDLDSWGLTNADGDLLATLPVMLLAPGDFLNVKFGVGTDDLDFSDGVGTIYTNGDSVVFDTYSDGVALYEDPNNSSTIVDATFWSSNGTAPSGSALSDAVSEGIWSAGDYFDADSALELSTYGLCPDGADHNDATDWRTFGWGEYHLSWTGSNNPIQLNPPHGGLLNDYGSVLSWGGRPFADSFQVQIDNNSTFTSPERNVRTSSTSYTVSGLANGSYYWRVRVYENGELLAPFATYQMIIDPLAMSGIGARTSVQLGVNRLIQHKDTRLLCDYDHRNSFRPGCEEAAGSDGPWDGAHGTDAAHVTGCEHCRMYCSRAVIAMINNFFDGDLSQDRISYELFYDNNPGPEADLGHLQGTALGSTGGAHGIRQRWQIYEWALGTAVTRSAGKPSFAVIQANIDAGRPIYIDGQNHATLVYGYYFENLQGSPTPAVYIHNPWPGTSGFSSYASWEPDESGWANGGYFIIPPGYAGGAIDQEASVTTDTDGDGAMNFDEQAVRNFHSVQNDVDTDDDEVNDKEEIKNYTHHDRATYHPGHDNNALDFPDVDSDGNRAENDCDSDNDSDFDGGEDINGDGHNPVPNAGNVCDRETCQFDAAESCIKVAVDKDTYLLGEPVHIVDIHYTRETHTYHAGSTYNYELGNGCPVKADGSALGHNGSFTTDAGGHALRKRVEYCLFPGQRYLTVDVLDDNTYSTPDNLDPQTCWTCATDWFHGFHWAYDYAVHNPSFPYPTWNFPSTCVFEGSGPSEVYYVIECPWWWWCFSWPPIFDSYWLGVQIDRHLVSDGIVSINSSPLLVQGTPNCGNGSTINTFSFDPILTQSLEGTSTDTSKQWLAFSIQNWQIPDSLLSTRVQLDVTVGTKMDVNPYVKIMAGDAVYGWSPTPYDSIPITVLSTCCVGIRGDVNNDGTDINILDLTYTVDRIFRGGPPAVCDEEGDVNNDGTPTNIIDLTFIVDRIFRGGPLPGPC